MTEFDTITDLRAATGTGNEVVLLKGYNNPRLGGGGHFIWQSDYLVPPTNGVPDNGIFIEPTVSNPNNGVWRRINYDYIDVKFFGAYGSGLFNGTPLNDDTIPIQEAIDFASNSDKPGAVVFISQGTYAVSQITLKAGVTIRGENSGTRILPFSDTGGSLVKMATGVVDKVEIEDLFFEGRDFNMNCFYLEAISGSPIPGGSSDAGLWYSSFKNITVLKFKKNGFTFIGGGLNQLNTGTYKFDRPNQFISLKNVTVVREPGDSGNRALLMKGQNGQFIFENCFLSGDKTGEILSGWNIELVGVRANPLSSPPVVATSPSIINFISCIIENSEGAVWMKDCRSIQINGSWFENHTKAILVDEQSIGITISNSRFSNAGGTGGTGVPNAGYILYSTEESSTVFKENLILGNYANNGSNNGSGDSVRASSNNFRLFTQNNLRKFNGINVSF